MNLFKKTLQSLGNSTLSIPNQLPIRGHGGREFEVDGWALSEFVLKKIVPVSGVHPFPLQELMLMCAAVCRLEPSLIFEWGTNIGKSARIFFETTEHYRIPCQIHSIDLPDDVSHVEHPHAQRGRMVRGLDRVHLHQGDGLETALEIWKQSGSPLNSLFFIDGDHSYESVIREITGILDSLPHAAVLLHDTFYQSPESGYNIGPHSAVSATVAKNAGSFQVIHSGLSLPGMSLVIPKRKKY
jgi:hypothetical protein